MLPASRCVVLVLVGGAIDPDCEGGLRELERRGYAVWRLRGYSAIDAARNQMASDALSQGFDELMWIDSDGIFDPDDVDKLRQHDLPPDARAEATRGRGSETTRCRLDCQVRKGRYAFE